VFVYAGEAMIYLAGHRLASYHLSSLSHLRCWQFGIVGLSRAQVLYLLVKECDTQFRTTDTKLNSKKGSVKGCDENI
jgi:hypothetical protein